MHSTSGRQQGIADIVGKAAEAALQGQGLDSR
jgi:hypothetical protein